jgi:hypothetical protein
MRGGRGIRSLVCALAMTAYPALLAAHHSFPVTFNTSRVTEVRGTITELRWQDPHVRFTVRADNGASWEVESNSIGGLSRHDISAETLMVGTAITIAGFPARNGDTRMYGSNLLLPDGSEKVLRPGSKPRWSQ